MGGLRGDCLGGWNDCRWRWSHCLTERPLSCCMTATLDRPNGSTPVTGRRERPGPRFQTWADTVTRRDRHELDISLLPASAHHYISRQLQKHDLRQWCRHQGPARCGLCRRKRLRLPVLNSAACFPSSDRYFYWAAPVRRQPSDAVQRTPGNAANALRLASVGDRGEAGRARRVWRAGSRCATASRSSPDSCRRWPV